MTIKETLLQNFQKINANKATLESGELELFVETTMGMFIGYLNERMPDGVTLEFDGIDRNAGLYNASHERISADIDIFQTAETRKYLSNIDLDLYVLCSEGLEAKHTVMLLPTSDIEFLAFVAKAQALIFDTIAMYA